MTYHLNSMFPGVFYVYDCDGRCICSCYAGWQRWLCHCRDRQSNCSKPCNRLLLNDSCILVFFGHSANSLFLFQCSVSSKLCQLFLYYVGSWRYWRRSYIAFFSFCRYCRRIVGILMYAITEHTYN